MSHKLILFVLLAGSIYLPTIFSEELTDEENENMHIKWYTDIHPHCNISDETYQLLLDGVEVNNEETLLYKLCGFEYFDWIKGLILNIKAIFKSLAILIGRKLSPSEEVRAQEFLEICKKEAELYTTQLDVLIHFIKCFTSRFQSDM